MVQLKAKMQFPSKKGASFALCSGPDIVDLIDLKGRGVKKKIPLTLGVD